MLKPYLLLIALTVLIVTSAACLANLSLTRIETDPIETFTLAPTLATGASNDKITVKMSVALCGNLRIDSLYQTGRWQSDVSLPIGHVSSVTYPYFITLRRIILVSSNPKT